MCEARAELSPKLAKGRLLSSMIDFTDVVKNNLDCFMMCVRTCYYILRNTIGHVYIPILNQIPSIGHVLIPIIITFGDRMEFYGCVHVTQDNTIKSETIDNNNLIQLL